MAKRSPNPLPWLRFWPLVSDPCAQQDPDNPHPWLHNQQVPCCQLKTFGGNSHRHPDTRILGQTQPCWPLYAVLATSGTPAHFPAPAARPLPTHLFHTDVQMFTNSPQVLTASQWVYFSHHVLKLNRETVGLRAVLVSHICPGLRVRIITQDKSHHRYVPNNKQTNKKPTLLN